MCTYIWNDDKFPFATDDVQLVWFHIFTNPLSSPLGVFRATIGGLAEDKNRNGQWPEQRYRHAFADAIRLGLLDYDAKALLVAFPKFFSASQTPNHPISPNQLKAWGERFNDLPNSHLKYKCYQSLKAIIEGKAQGMLDAFLDAFTLPSAMPSAMGRAIPDPNPNPNPDPKTKPKQEKKDKTSGELDDCSPTGVPAWNAYEVAYVHRYSVKPVRNRTTNSQMKQFVSRIGQTDAPQVAAFYLTHNGHNFVRQRHPVGLLLHEAEGLHTQWMTGIKATTSEMKNVEFKDNVVGQADRVIANMEKRGSHE